MPIKGVQLLSNLSFTTFCKFAANSINLFVKRDASRGGIFVLVAVVYFCTFIGTNTQLYTFCSLFRSWRFWRWSTTTTSTTRCPRFWPPGRVLFSGKDLQGAIPTKKKVNLADLNRLRAIRKFLD